MAFRLRSNESVAHGLRRLARKELHSAREELRQTHPPPDEAIHEARKSIKKVRAIHDLIDADAGRGLGRDRKRLRKVNGRLSKLRDADAMLEILNKLKDREPQLFSEHTFARLRRRLSSHKITTRHGAKRTGAWKKIDRDLRQLRKHARGWRPTHRRFRALAEGIRTTLRRGRKAMARAHERRAAEDFHEWRKHVKALWYELRLLEGCSPEIGRDVAALHRAETSLGDDHNIAVLFDELSKGSASGVAGLHRAARRHQAELRHKAALETKRIYEASSGGYVRRLKRAWKAWHRRTATDATSRPHRDAA